MKFLSLGAHQLPFYVGSPYNREMAFSLRDKFRAWGFDADVAAYHVLFPKPRVREVTLLEPVRYEARLHEPPVEGDRTSAIERTGCHRTTRTRRMATSRRSWST